MSIIAIISFRLIAPGIIVLPINKAGVPSIPIARPESMLRRKIRSNLLASGKFELRETNTGTFDIVAKSGTKNDMVKITFNIDDADGKIVTRSEKINNVETYTAVQIKQKYGDYLGNKSVEEALKAKEHAFKGGAKNNNDLTCFSHACDEAFNTSTKTAHKLIKDAPSFVIISSHIFFVSSSPKTFGKKLDIISYSFCSTSNKSVRLFFL